MKKSDDIEPTVVSYSAALSACEKGGQWELALELLELMRSQMQPNVFAYSACISACGAGGEWQKSVELHKEMIRAGVEPSLISFNAVLEALPMSELAIGRAVVQEAMSYGHYQIWASSVSFLPYVQL